MTQATKKIRELDVFRAFARASHRFVRRRSKRQAEPPGPDIVCKSLLGREVGYELVEALDQGIPWRLASALDAQARLLDAYLALPEDRRRALHRRGAVVTFRDGVTEYQRRDAVPGLLDVIGRSPHDHNGRVAVPRSLQTVVEAVDLCPSHLEHPVFHVSSAGDYGDPLLECIENKFGKEYVFDGPLELVAYYEGQDSLPIELRRKDVTEFLKRRLGQSPFRRAWVYDHPERRVLLAVPAWRCSAHGVLRRRL